MSKCENILIGCSGSVAALKLPELTKRLLSTGYKVKIIATQHSQHFFSKDDVPSEVEFYTDEDEWSAWKSRGDPVMHIELSKWADIFLIAPLDANTLAKLANGLCDNLLTCAARAWDLKKPFLFCPAMNTRMYEHPLTSTQIQILQGWGYKLVPVVSKTLICGDTGLGAMAEVETIVNTVKELCSCSSL